VIRFLTIVSAAALTSGVPAVALAAPGGGLPVYHPSARTSGSTTSSSRSDSSSQEPFRVHSDLNARPQTRQLDPQITWTPPRLTGWRSAPGTLLYQPAWLQTGCGFNGPLAGPGFSSSTPAGPAPAPTDFTIGSLVDGQQKLIGSSPSDIARVTSSGSSAEPSAGPLTLQYSVGESPCGSTNPFGFY
jgi:hypothetical protein